MGHTHAEKNKCKLATMFTLNFCFFLVELGVGSWTRSMSLVADSFHMLSDVAALIVAFFAIKMSQKKWSKNTYGWARAEVLGALVNSVFLAALCFSILIESVKRFFEPQSLTQPELILVVGTIGLLMNLAGLCIFRDSHSHGHSHDVHPGGELGRRRSTLTHQNRLTRMVQSSNLAEEDEEVSVEVSEAIFEGDGGKEELKELQVAVIEPKPRAKVQSKNSGQMNMRGVFLHLLADTLGSVIVVVSATVVYLKPKWTYTVYIDPCLSIVMVLLILVSVYPLFVESSLILLQSVPDHIKIDELERKLLKQIDGVIGVHELHVWQLAGDRIIATAHIKCTNLQEYFDIAKKIVRIFHSEGIHSTTIQPEFSQQNPGKDGEAMECYLSCSALSTDVDCASNTCCPPDEDKENNGAGRRP